MECGIYDPEELDAPADDVDAFPQPAAKKAVVPHINGLILGPCSHTMGAAQSINLGS